MSDDQNTEPRRRLNPGLLLLLLLLLLLCLCMATPSLANLGGFFDVFTPIGDITQPIVCRVPQLAAVAVFCPQGERGAFCGQTCDPAKPDACGAFEDVSCQKDATGKFSCGGPGCVNLTDTGGRCFATCDPNVANSCAEGLRCVQALTSAANAGFTCQGNSCQPTSTTGGQTTGGQTDGGGQADCRCDPQKGDMLCTKPGDTALYVTPQAPECNAEQGCACEGVDYICRSPDGSVASAKYNVSRCGGTDACVCHEGDPNKSAFCPDGAHPFNPLCGVGGTTGGGQCTCVANPNYPATSRDPFICRETGDACKPSTVP